MDLLVFLLIKIILQYLLFSFNFCHRAYTKDFHCKELKGCVFVPFKFNAIL